MNRTITYRITKLHTDRTIRSYLKNLGYSTQNLTGLKNTPDSVLLNSQPAFLNRFLQAGDELTIHIRETAVSAKIPPVELPLDIVYEDEDLLVINKPAGMPIHPSMNNYTNSLGNALAWYFAKQNKPFVFRCINRLDRDTSGLTIVAKHAVSAGILSAMVAAKKAAKNVTPNTVPDTSDIFVSDPADEFIPADHPVMREYLAISRGLVTPASGTITAPLSRKEGSVIERQVDFEHGERAVTHYSLLEYKNGHSLLSLQLETGRTHQIRIHMKYLGFPLIGDYLYNPDMEYISRQALHSHQLRFTHPITHEPMCFVAPLPQDMQAVLNRE